jgi:hypothetical protein
MRKWSFVAMTLAVTVASSIGGCGGASRYLVQTRLLSGDRGEVAPEVVRATAAPAVAARRIAVVWPSECANETSAAQRGDALSNEALASLDCSVEMAALERVLVSQGFQVVHWDSIRRAALASSVSPEQAAERAGVGLLLRVNSLERSTLVPGADARWEREYFHENGGLAVVMPAVADQLERFSATAEDGAVQSGRLAVALDVTAVHVPSGEVLWFYRWVHQDAASAAVTRSVRVECAGYRCVDLGEARAVEPLAERGPRSGSTRALSVQAEDASAQRAVYARLMFEALANLATTVRQLHAGGSSAPATAPETGQ